MTVLQSDHYTEVSLYSTSFIPPGVKQPPIDNLIEGKTFVVFSHTIKAQKENMPLLDAMLEKVGEGLDKEG